MGKAIVISVALILIVATVVALVAWNRRQDSKDKAREKGWALAGDLNRKQELALKNLIDEAADIMHTIRNPPIDAPDYVSYLSPDDRSKVEQWLRTYEGKVLER
jgi:hypothetical protein